MPLHSRSPPSLDGHNRPFDGHNGQDPGGPELKVFIKDVADKHGRKRVLKMKTWSTIKDIKDSVQKLLHVPQSAQLIYFGPLMASGFALPNYRTLSDAGVYRSGETLLLKIKGEGTVTSGITMLKSEGRNDVCISPSLLDTTPSNLRRTVQQARRGLALGLKPDLVLDGSGGTYFLRDARKVPVAVFKPADEEPYAENNPRGYVRTCGAEDEDCDDSMSMRVGIKPGEACLREVAAFFLDHDGFSRVPMTTLAEARHPTFNYDGSMMKLNQGGAAVGRHSLKTATSLPEAHLRKKVGSWQEFVRTDCSMDDLSPSKLSVDEVHKIAILDIRIMNADRNPANLLCRRNHDDPDAMELIPIDHGYCLRSVADVCWFDWCWLDWPQLKQPLNKQSRKFILGLDIEADVRMLQERLRLPTKALDYFRASSKLLQDGVRAGLTLYEIAILCCRNDNKGEIPSPLETLMTTATDLASSAVQSSRWHHTAASRAIAHQLSPENEYQEVTHRHSTYTSLGHKNNMLKSASSINISSFSIDADKHPRPPPMQPSGSDDDEGSSDTGDGSCDEGACKEWAASVLATKLDVQISPSAIMRQRACSVISADDSDGSSSGSESSSSDDGFWCVPPSSTKRQDHEDFSWSPTVIPDNTATDPETEVVSFRRQLSVKFDVLIPPKSGGREEVKVQEPFEQSTPLRKKIVAPSLLRRCQSYSGTSLKKMHGITISTKNGVSTRIINSSTEQYRVYLLKFIDLLVIREVRMKVGTR
eukprot:CAMPEP_0198257172 /NCGR_PEP_ID=MMETSP1447-20131203/6908_1 /TAXON_ID=420782 /ORGANISM="Chaetoceros dichaeta, Strain CCMP1751" /LENGTH=758 /DNA_ID=CAMNT_0043944001 /DNA_START=394 /DNA_END=2670 /DNA_ORIENTATION=+